MWNTMQLFISEQYTLKENIVHIEDERIIYQCHKVLRLKAWSIIQLQNKNQRYTLDVSKSTSQILEGQIITKEELPDSDSQVSIVLALPNRRDKAELMVQKLSELGVQEIVFWPAQRSILRSIPSKKQERLEKIALEAAEQSFRTTLLSIKFLDKLDKNITLWKDCIVLADQEGKNSKDLAILSWKKTFLWIIGPEWWLTSQEKKLFDDFSVSLSLWKTMFRMETAAIVLARLLTNQ